MTTSLHDLEQALITETFPFLQINEPLDGFLVCRKLTNVIHPEDPFPVLFDVNSEYIRIWISTCCKSTNATMSVINHVNSAIQYGRFFSAARSREICYEVLFPLTNQAYLTSAQIVSSYCGLLPVLIQNFYAGFLELHATKKRGKSSGSSDDTGIDAARKRLADMGLAGDQFVMNIRFEQYLEKPSTKKMIPRDLEAGIEESFFGIRFCWIPPGTFVMGSLPKDKAGCKDETPVHTVTLTRGFWMGKYQITQKEWQVVMGNNPSASTKNRNEPVEQVSWDNCQEFIHKLNQYDHGYFRLPTEAEWEYACRAGSTDRFSFGNSKSVLKEYAWYYKTNKTLYHHIPHPVGEKKPNTWGLHDMHGNVWEWCSDWYAEYPADAQTDPIGPENGEFRVLRGGSCNQSIECCRSAIRNRANPKYGYFDVGFRLVREA